MESSPRLSLERSMDQFRRELTDAQMEEISGANRLSINHVIQKIQTKLGREKSLCRLSRMTRFLDVMEEIEKLVTIFLNVSEAVAFVWGPIKLVLMVAKTWTDSVESIIDVYEEIADALDNLAVFHNLISGNEQLKRMLEDYFSDILRFHSCIVAFFYKPDWKKTFNFFWKGFRRNVQPIIESLKRKQTMLSDERLQQHAILKGLHDAEAYTKDQFEQIHSGLGDVLTSDQIRRKQQEKEEIKSCMERKLNVSSSRTTSPLELPETFIESSGRWIFSDPLFQSWVADTSSERGVLYLNGCPGAGKSTLARTIIRHLHEKRSQESQNPFSLAYFFFKHSDADRRSTRSMLCHLITQIINADDVMMRYAYDACASMDYLEFSFLKHLALECLLSSRNTVIVLDGLDEAMDNEPENVLKWCLFELLRMASSRGHRVRLLICGQEDGRIEPFLSSYPQIRLHAAEKHQNDIEKYSAIQVSVISQRFGLSAHDKAVLTSKVKEATKGMFLYARVVLANLASMGSRKEYKAELNNNTFPRNLDEAYGRILQRVIHSARPSAQASAKTILGWLVCSERPLRWREIQSRFCIDADTGICDPDDLRADSCKQLCSSLVDVADCEIFPAVKSEQVITMIHETAKKYLIHTNTVNLMQEHIDMSLFCCRYLVSRPFRNAEKDVVAKAIQSGYFGFMDYAAVYYESHIQKAEISQEQTGSSSVLDVARVALSDLKDVYYRHDSNSKSEQASVPEHLERIGKVVTRAIEDKLLHLRASIDQQREGLSQNTDFQDLQGPRRYNCTRIKCSKFFVGYPNETGLQQHLDSHERPFRCKDEDCVFHIIGYEFQRDLHRHNRTFHNDNPKATLIFPGGTKAVKMDIAKACGDGNLRHVMLLHTMNVKLQETHLKAAIDAGHGHICKYLIENGINPFGEAGTPYEMSPMHNVILKKDFHLLEVLLFGCPELKSSIRASQLEISVEDMIANYPAGVVMLKRLLFGKPRDGSVLSYEFVEAEELAILFRTWGQQITSFPTSLDVLDHSNNAKPIHAMFCRLYPNLYDDGRFSPSRHCREFTIYHQTIERKRFLLHHALLGKQYPLAAFLMDIDIDNVMQIQDQDGNSPLHCFVMASCGAVCKGCEIMVQLLVDRDSGGLAHEPNGSGQLPAHIALNRNISPRVLRTVLKFSRDLNHKDKWGLSPLHYVQSEEALNTLLQQTDVNFFIRNDAGQTCFIRFCSETASFNEGVMRRLLAIDIRFAWTADDSGRGLTPLHYALDTAEEALPGDRRAAMLLLELPEIEQIVRAYWKSANFDFDIEKIRGFVQMNQLQGVQEVLNRIDDERQVYS